MEVPPRAAARGCARCVRRPPPGGGRRARLCGCPVFYSRGLHFLNISIHIHIYVYIYIYISVANGMKQTHNGHIIPC